MKTENRDCLSAYRGRSAVPQRRDVFRFIDSAVSGLGGNRRCSGEPIAQTEVSIGVAARAGLPLVVIIANDGARGSEFHEQKTSTGKTFNTELGFQAYEKIAEAFGCEGYIVSARPDLAPAL